MILCEYGCGTEGKYLLKVGKWCCSESNNSCKGRRKTNSDGLKKAYNEGRKRRDNFKGNHGWQKGKTYVTDPRIKSMILEKFDEYFCVHDKFINMDTIKKFLKRTKLLSYECSICGMKPQWNNKKLTLHLDHIDGNRKNNKLSNLRWLDPNCHSQTETYCSNRNTKYKKQLDEITVIKKIKESASISETLKKLNLSQSGLNYERIKNLMSKYNVNLNVIPQDMKIRRRYQKRLKIKCKFEKCNTMIRETLKTGYCRPCYNKIVNVKIKERPDAQTLLKEVIASPILQVGKKYGVSDNAIRKWLKSYGLPHRSSDLKKLVKLIL